MNKHQLMVEADKLLQKTDIYNVANRCFITSMFEGHNRGDMQLNIEVTPQQVRLFMLERATCVWEYITEKEEVVIYAVILYVLTIIIDKAAYELYKNDKGNGMYYSKEVIEYKKRLKEDMFIAIGTPYLEWYRRGVTLWKIKEIEKVN